MTCRYSLGRPGVTCHACRCSAAHTIEAWLLQHLRCMPVLVQQDLMWRQMQARGLR